MSAIRSGIVRLEKRFHPGSRAKAKMEAACRDFFDGLSDDELKAIVAGKRVVGAPPDPDDPLPDFTDEELEVIAAQGK